MKLATKLIAALSGLGVASFLAFGGYPGSVRPSAAERKTMEQYIEDMQPVCFGRFMMGIPRNSTAWNGLAEYVFANFEEIGRAHV